LLNNDQPTANRQSFTAKFDECFGSFQRFFVVRVVAAAAVVVVVVVVVG
jgi:hypothetical protein